MRLTGWPPSGDEGQITVLMVMFTAVAAAVIMMAVDASLVFLGRQRLASAVDGAAVSAAQQFDQSSYYSGGCVNTLPLSQEAVDRVLAGYAKDGIMLTAEAPPADGGSGVDVVGRLVIDLPDIPVLGLTSYTVNYRTNARSNVSGAPC